MKQVNAIMGSGWDIKGWKWFRGEIYAPPARPFQVSFPDVSLGRLWHVGGQDPGERLGEL